jgi:uncharacterized membrane protein
MCLEYLVGTGHHKGASLVLLKRVSAQRSTEALLRSAKFCKSHGMSWLFFAFSGPILWAISMHFDKYLVERYFKSVSVAVLLVFTAMTGLVALPFIGFFRPDVLALPISSVLVIGFSGLLFMGAMFFYLVALQSEEASVIAPFFQASPVFAYGLGYLVLGERLSWTQIAGGALIVLGALLLSVRPGGLKRFRGALVFPMLACAFALALASLVFKFFAVRDEFWTTVFWIFAGQAIFGAIILAIPHFRGQFVVLMRQSASALIAISAVNELVNLGGSLGARYALVLAPLSLVQAITSTTPLFVYIFGTLISIFFPSIGREDLSARELVTKGVAALLIAFGVTMITR